MCVVEKMKDEAAADAVKKLKSETRVSWSEQQQTESKSKQKSSDRDSVDTGSKTPSIQVTYRR